MSTGELIEMLLDEGLPASYGRAQAAINSGAVDRPRLDGTGNRVWHPDQIAQLRRYLTNPPRPGRQRRRRRAAA